MNVDCYHNRLSSQCNKPTLYNVIGLGVEYCMISDCHFIRNQRGGKSLRTKKATLLK